MDATWGGGIVTTFKPPYVQAAGCVPETAQLNFLPWLPYGLLPSDGYTDGQGDPQGYFCRPYTPSGVFWGWSYIIGPSGLIDQVLGKAQAAGLSVPELEMLNEMDLADFNVQARLIYDNTTSTAVAKTVGQLMANHGFTSTAVTASVGIGGRPCNPGSGTGCLADCSSLYGDSAQVEPTDELQSAFYGGVFGEIPYIAWNSTMPCDGSTQYCGPVGGSGWYACATKGMITLPGTHPVPTITDIHATPCVLTSNKIHTCTTLDATAAADTFYSDVWAYLQYRGLTADPMVFGETSSDQSNPACDNDTPALASQNAAGFLRSTLWSQDASNVRLRPWDVPEAPTNCTTPITIGAPTGPYAP